MATQLVACSVQTGLVKLMPRTEMTSLGGTCNALHAQTLDLLCRDSAAAKTDEAPPAHAGEGSAVIKGKPSGQRITQHRVIRANRACEGK